MRRNDRRAVVEAKHMLPQPEPEPDWTCPTCGLPLGDLCEACDDEVEEMLNGIEDGWAQERRTQ